jgi:hypothetical protein
MKHAILNQVSEWLTFLLHALPPKTRPTILELLVGAIISASGHITEAILSLGSDYHWTTYYKMIEYVKFRWSLLLR